MTGQGAARGLPEAKSEAKEPLGGEQGWALLLVLLPGRAAFTPHPFSPCRPSRRAKKLIPVDNNHTCRRKQLFDAQVAHSCCCRGRPIPCISRPGCCQHPQARVELPSTPCPLIICTVCSCCSREQGALHTCLATLQERSAFARSRALANSFRLLCSTLRTLCCG